MKRKPKKKQSETRSVTICGLPDFEWSEICKTGYVPLSKCPDIQTPVNRIAELLSSMTLRLMENSELGDVRVKNELSRKVDIEPNKYTNRKEFFYSIVKNMLLDGEGNAIVYPKYKNGLLDDLIPFDMSQTSFTTNENQYGYYIIYKGVRYEPDEVLHFRANPDPQKPWIGTGYKVLLRDIANNLTQAQKTKKTFMENPAPSMIVKVEGLAEEFASPEGRENLVNQYYEGTKTGKPWMIPATLMEVQEVRPLNLSDLAINESVSIDKKTAAAIFGVPPFFVGVGDFNKEAYNAFINNVILPLAKSIEQELTRKLIYGSEWFFKFNSRSLYAYDLKELIEAGAQMADRIALGRNEWRDWVGLEPRDDMQTLLGLENYIPVEMLGLQKKLIGNEGKEGEKIWTEKTEEITT